MSHLEDLITEYYDWKGYLVKRNIKVGPLPHGGFEMELDVIAYHPHSKHLVHVEASLDADTWAKRKQRFAKKFAAARKYIFKDIFTWLDPVTTIEQIAMLVSHPKNREELCGGRLQSVDEFAALVRAEIVNRGKMSKSAIPEQYPNLRTIQLLTNGYYGIVS
jgi:hypothetical protein